MSPKTTIKNVLTLAALALAASCGSGPSGELQAIVIDGSSTVYPITQAIVEEFNAANKNPVEATIGFSGTGGGFKKFCAGETDINNASRPISRNEMETCKQNEVFYIELPVAFDALTVAVNPQNTWASEITVAELKKIWEPGAQRKITKWNQIRPNWPDRPLNLYGPGTDSGTFDYFTEAIVGKAGASRSDYTASEDDEILERGVSSDINALGYFGFSYYEQNKNDLKALAIDNDGGSPVLPSVKAVENNEYRPLARPLFIYVNAAPVRDNLLMAEFLDFYLQNAARVVSSVGYVPFDEDDYLVLYRNYHKTKVGTVFGGESQFDLTIDEVLTKRAEY